MRTSRRAVVTLVVITVLGVAIGAAHALQSRTRLWQPATHEFQTECDGTCDSLGEIRLAHGGGVVPVYAQPRVDDDIAQWARCMDAVLGCMADTLSRRCVADSPCPAKCKERFATASIGITDSLELLAEFERLFLDSGAYCTPR